MYSKRQRQILAEITHGLELPIPAWEAVRVEQSPSYIDSVVETADFAATVLGAIGSVVALIGERRGLEITEHGDRYGARNGCGGHHQQMRRRRRLAA